jgi:hypothetical protein
MTSYYKTGQKLKIKPAQELLKLGWRWNRETCEFEIDNRSSVIPTGGEGAFITITFINGECIHVTSSPMVPDRVIHLSRLVPIVDHRSRNDIAAVVREARGGD